MGKAGLPKYEPCLDSHILAPEQKVSTTFGRLLRRSLVACAFLSAGVGIAVCIYRRAVEARRPLWALPDKPWVVADREAFFQQYPVGAVTTLSPDDQASLAICTIDVWQAFGRLGMIGTLMDFTIKTCQLDQVDDTSRAKCSQAINILLAQITLAAALISSSVSDCALSVNPKAQCSSNINGLLGNMFAAVGSASGVNVSCSAARNSRRRLSASWNGTADGLPEGFGAAAVLRQMKRVKGNNETNPDRPRVVASCFFDVVQATGFLARFSLALRTAIKLCSPEALDSLEHPAAPRKCAVDVLSMIASFGLASAFIASLINDCPLEGSVDAACARDVSALIATLSGSAAFAGNVKTACSGVQAGQNPGDEVTQEERRLAALELQYATGQTWRSHLRVNDFLRGKDPRASPLPG